MRKTGLCGVVIATLFGTAGLLQHPSHQEVKQHHTQQHQQQSSSPFAQAGVNLLDTYHIGGRSAATSVTLLPDGFLWVVHKPGPSPAQIAAHDKAVSRQRAKVFEQTVATEQAAQAQAEAEAQAAAAAAQAQAEAEAAQAAAAAQAQAAAAAAAQAQASTAQTSQPAPAGGVWAELRACESGGNYAEDTGNGYYGAYQFALSTWEGLGFSGLPSDAPPGVQDEAAQELQAAYGWDQWPACAAELGL
jgi:multidrug efflux pump subunit AcrA (membrane-fusion protein)